MVLKCLVVADARAKTTAVFSVLVVDRVFSIEFSNLEYQKTLKYVFKRLKCLVRIGFFILIKFEGRSLSTVMRK